MTKKIVLEVPIGETEWVDAPMVFSTPIGDFDKFVKVQLFERITNYIKNSKDDIINMEYRNRRYFIAGLIEDFGRNILTDNELSYYIESYDRWLMGFREGVGYSFQDAEFSHSVKCNGKKIKLIDRPALHLTERDLVKVLVQNFISNFNSDVFDYRIE